MALRHLGPRKLGNRWGSLTRAVVGSLLALACAAPASGQNAYDPFSQQGGQNGGSGNGAANGGNLQQQSAPGVSSATSSTGAVESFSPTQIPSYSARNQQNGGDLTGGLTTPPRIMFVPIKPIAPPLSEFELYVGDRAGKPLPRFGSLLLSSGTQNFLTPPTTTVPPDYALNPGDELLIGITGSVEADMRLVIDSEGRVFVPRIGEITVAGIKYGDLLKTLARRFDQQYRKVKVSVVIGRLHGLTVYVTGFAVSPGAFTVSSLSTMVDAVFAAGGPTGGGSFRNIQLMRGGRLVTSLDLYDVLLNGDKSRDVSLQNGDVLNIAPVGPELAITGSVNEEAIYEARPGETLATMIRYAGGGNSLADESRVLVASLADLDSGGSRQLDARAAAAEPARRGDLVRVLSLANISRPLERQAVLATIEGEVDHPGRYFLAPGSNVGDLLTRAGGLTGGAFVFGTQVQRDSLRAQQQASFDRAIDDLQLAAAAAPLSGLSGVSADRAAASAARSQASLAIIDRLKARKPDGRLVLTLGPDATALPGDLTLENNDRIFVPPRPKTVGVFGAVYQTGSFLFTPGLRVADYLKLAGGPQRIADRGEIFVVRANGSVLSSYQTHDFARRFALPGDVIFVPVKTSGGVFERILAIAAVVYQFGVGALTLKALGA